MQPLLIHPILAVALAAAPGAATAPVPPPAPHPKIGEVMVVGGPRPKVVASYPADGGEAPGGVLVIKIIFDQPMTPEGWSFSRAEGGDFPNCLERPRLLADQRTFVLLCTVAGHTRYAIDINAPADFASVGGRSAKAARLGFTTGDNGPVNVHDALVKAGLSDADEPIMRWRDAGAGVSQSSPKTAEADDTPGP